MTTKLFVGSLPYSVGDETLQNLFESIGQVVSAKVIVDRYSGQSKGIGFVEMSSAEEAQEAIEKLNGQAFEGRRIVVSEARPQEPRERRPGGNGGYGGHRDGGRDGGRRRFDDGPRFSKRRDE